MTCVRNPSLFSGVIRSKGNLQNKGALVINIVLFLGGAKTSSSTAWVCSNVLNNFKENVLIGLWNKVALNNSVWCSVQNANKYLTSGTMHSHGQKIDQGTMSTNKLLPGSISLYIFQSSHETRSLWHMNKPSLERGVEWQQAWRRLLNAPMAFLLSRILQP